MPINNTRTKKWYVIEGVMAAKKFYLLLFLLLLQSCGETEVESLDDIFVRSDQERAELKIATELQISEPVFGKYIGPETSLTFEIVHTNDTVKIDFYHTSFCDGEPAETLKVITSRESSRIDYSKIKRNQTNYFSAKSYGPHGETIGCSNTIKFLQSADASSLDFMIVYEASDETCNLSGDTLDSILTNCNGVKFDFETLNNVLSSPLVSLKYYNSSDCSGVQSGSHDVESDGLQDSYVGLSEGSNDYSFKFKDEKNKEVCVDFSVNKDTTAPVNATSFSLINPDSGKVYENEITLDIEIQQVDPPHQGSLKIFNTNDCTGDALYSKSLVSTDTTVNAQVNFDSLDVGEHNLFLYLEDKIGNGSCFDASGISYNVVGSPNFILSTLSPSPGDDIEITIENQIIGVNTQIYHTTDCTGESWYDISPTAAEEHTVTGLEISPGGRYSFSYISGDENSSTGCINSAETHEVFWRAPSVASISSSVDPTPNFLLTNISDQIADGLDITVDFFEGAGCAGANFQTTNYTKSSSVSIEIEDEVVGEDDYSYSFSYSYDGIRSICSEVSDFTYRLPLISVVNLSDNDPFAPGESSTSDTYLKLKINSLDELSNKIISIHKDPKCLLKGFSQQFLLSSENSYESTSLEEYFLDGPKEYPLYVRYEDLATGESHCYEETSVTILFNDLDSYDDFFVVDGDGKITEVKIDMYKHYQLTSDIDFVGRSFQSIGSELEPFEGHFFGGGNRLENLSLSIGDLKQVGIFGVQGEKSVIYEMTLKNVDLVNTNASNNASTGLIAGESFGTIERISIEPTSSVNGKVNTGGLVGLAQGATIRLCKNEGTVVGTDNVGGLVGNLDGPHAYTDHTDYFPATSVLVNSVNFGDVTGSNNIGGIAGKMSGVIGYSYSMGEISGGTNVGGLVGKIKVYRPSIHYSFSGATVSGDENVAGLVGLNENTGEANNIIQKSYHTQEVCYNYNSSPVTAKATCYDSPGGGAEAEVSLVDISAFYGDGACNELYFGCGSVYSPVVGDIPKLDFDGIDPIVPSSTTNEFGLSGGTGTRSDPLIVENIEEWLGLESFSNHNHLHTVLKKDLTFNNDPETYEFNPFNNRTTNYYFTGVLDGGYHSLSNITYQHNTIANTRYGLLIGSSLGGEVKSLTFEDSTVDLMTYSGLISSWGIGGRFNKLIFDNVNFNYYGAYSGFVSGGQSLGEIISDVTIVNSNLISQNKNGASYNGFISGLSRNSSYKDIIIRGSKLKDGADYPLNMAGMVTGRTDYFNQYHSLSIDVDIELQRDSSFIGGIIGWSYLRNKIENSHVNGTIYGGLKNIGGFIGGSYTVYFKNNISEITISERVYEELKCYDTSGLAVPVLATQETCEEQYTWKVLAPAVEEKCYSPSDEEIPEFNSQKKCEGEKFWILQPAKYCSGFSGYNYKNGGEHSSIEIHNSVSIPSINCSSGHDAEDNASTDQLNFAFNHYYKNTNMNYNFWFDADNTDQIYSCYRSGNSGEPKAPCSSIEDLNGVVAPSYDAGTLEYFWDYFFFETTGNAGAEFSEDYWLDLGGVRPRVRGHPAF